MKPGPKLALTALPDFISLDSPPQSAVQVLTEISFSKEWASTRAEAGELAERWGPEFLKIARRHRNQLIETGRYPIFDFNSSSEYMVQGAAFVEPKDPPDVRAAKEKRARLADYARLLAALEPHEFEALCRGMLDLLRVEDPVLTQRVADEGIDFYGHLHLEKHIFPEDKYPVLQRQLAVWMIGQAKHYRAAPVSTFEIRDLVGAVELAKGKAYGSAEYAELSIRPCDPVFCLFFTTGKLSHRTWRLLDLSGVVGMDGEMVAAFLADRDVGVVDNAFSREEFLSWLARQLT